MELVLRHFLNNLFLPVIFLCPATLLIGGSFLLARSTQGNHQSHRWIAIPTGLVTIFTAIFFFLVVYDSSGFVRFIFMGLLALATGLSAIFASIQGVLHRHDFERNQLVLYFVGAFLVAVSSGLGRLGSNAIVGQCERFHLDTGNIIVSAMENYYSDNKQYPDSLSVLIPNYVRTGSIKTCYSLRVGQENLSIPQFAGFYYKKCPLGTTQLSIPEMGSGHFHIYDLSEKKWYTSRGDPLEEAGRTIFCQDYQ